LVSDRLISHKLRERIGILVSEPLSFGPGERRVEEEDHDDVDSIRLGGGKEGEPIVMSYINVPLTKLGNGRCRN
jgi:hypothetical protein